MRAVADQQEDQIEQPLGDEQEEPVQREIVSEEHCLEPGRPEADERHAERGGSEPAYIERTSEEAQREAVQRAHAGAHANRAQQQRDDQEIDRSTPSEQRPQRIVQHYQDRADDDGPRHTGPTHGRFLAVSGGGRSESRVGRAVARDVSVCGMNAPSDRRTESIVARRTESRTAARACASSAAAWRAMESPAAAMRRVAESALTAAPPHTLPVPWVTRWAFRMRTVLILDGVTAGRTSCLLYTSDAADE